MKLAGKELAEHVIVVIGRRRDDVNLAAVIGAVSIFRPLEKLILFGQVPPQFVQILRWIAI